MKLPSNFKWFEVVDAYGKITHSLELDVDFIWSVRHVELTDEFPDGEITPTDIEYYILTNKNGDSVRVSAASYRTQDHYNAGEYSMRISSIMVRNGSLTLSQLRQRFTSKKGFDDEVMFIDALQGRLFAKELKRDGAVISRCDYIDEDDSWMD